MADLSNVAPDLHHKMSKKIAQLTKVIYHLNTMNEDNQFSIEATNAAHSQEIQTILRDASAKINRFREQVRPRDEELLAPFAPPPLTPFFSFTLSRPPSTKIDEKKSEVNAQAQIEQLKKKHDVEKKNALSTLSEYKTKFDEVR